MVALGFLTKLHHSNNTEKVYADSVIKEGNQPCWYMISTSENKDLKNFLIISNGLGGGTGEYLMVSTNRI